MPICSSGWGADLSNSKHASYIIPLGPESLLGSLNVTECPPGIAQSTFTSQALESSRSLVVVIVNTFMQKTARRCNRSFADIQDPAFCAHGSPSS